MQLNSVNLLGLKIGLEILHKIVERELKLSIDREKNLLSKNANNKYEFFCKTYPGLETRISQVHVASFIGISPVSLSRLKSQRKP